MDFTKIKDTKSNSFEIIFGKKVLDNCFDFNLKEAKYLDLLRFIKNHEKWELVSKKNIKIFYYYDLKLIVDDEGNINLEKDILNSYYDYLNKDNEGFRLLMNTEVKEMDVNIFPGLDKINDIRKIREIIFKNSDNNYIKFLIVNHSNKEITYETKLYSNDLNKLSNSVNKLLDFMNLKVQKKAEYDLDNCDKLSLSVI